MSVPSDPEVVLVVDTPTGVFFRNVAAASELAAGADPGAAAEDATRATVSRWAMPDFVYESVKRAKGAADREVGDVLLIHGRTGVVVQVKHRAEPKSDEAREIAWVHKSTGKAIRQVNGTVRTLGQADVSLRNGRGRVVPVPAGVEWMGVVIVDHPSPPGDLTVDITAAAVPTVVMLRRDWDFLFEQLRSTGAVLGYLRRATADGPVPLGDEPVRYYEFADADEQAPPDSMPDVMLAGAVEQSTPLLPKTPVGLEDRLGHLLVRQLLEDIATTRGQINETDRLQVLSEIDLLPVGARADLGRHLMTQLDEVAHAAADSYAWRFRTIRLRSVPQLMFGVCNRFNEHAQDAFRQWATVRHHDYGVQTGDMTVISVSVLITPRSDGFRPFDTTMVSLRGDLQLTDDELASMRKLWAKT